MACDTTLRNQQKLAKKYPASIGQSRCYCDCRFVKAQQKGSYANNADHYIEEGRRHLYVCS